LEKIEKEEKLSSF